MVMLTVDLLNGDTQCVAIDDDESVEALKKRLSAVTGWSCAKMGLCCKGEVLSNRQCVGGLPSTMLVAWTPRFTKHRSDAASDMAAAERHLEAQRRQERERPVWQRVASTARLHGPALMAALRTVSLRTWVKAVVWFVLMLMCRHYRLGQPFVITTLIVLMLSNLGERKPGELSAYTVFNEGQEALPGQLRMEDFEREMRHD